MVCPNCKNEIGAAACCPACGYQMAAVQNRARKQSNLLAIFLIVVGAVLLAHSLFYVVAFAMGALRSNYSQPQYYVVVVEGILSCIHGIMALFIMLSGIKAMKSNSNKLLVVSLIMSVLYAIASALSPIVNIMAISGGTMSFLEVFSQGILTFVLNLIGGSIYTIVLVFAILAVNRKQKGAY